MPPYGVDQPTIEMVNEVAQRYNGTVVNDYCQAADTRLERNYSATRGWCLAMSIHWVAKKKNGGDFFNWMQTPGADGSLRFIMNRQENIVFQANTQMAAKQRVGWSVDSDYRSRSAFPLKRLGVVHRGTYEAASLSSFQIPADCLFDTPGKYAIIHFIKVRGGHTIAACLEDAGGAILMDANLGEIRFGQKSGFVGFLDECGSNPGLGYIPIQSCVLEKYD